MSFGFTLFIARNLIFWFLKSKDQSKQLKPDSPAKVSDDIKQPCASKDVKEPDDKPAVDEVMNENVEDDQEEDEEEREEESEEDTTPKLKKPLYVVSCCRVCICLETNLCFLSCLGSPASA